MSHCEAVVCLNAPPMGRARVQARGRARKQGSEFVSILESHPLETALHAKAVKEDRNLDAVLQWFPAAMRLGR